MDHISTAKVSLREQLVTARGRLPVALIGERARLIAQHLMALPEVRRAATVASYVSVGREPGTGPLLEALAAAGKRVILPLLQADHDLDWACYTGPNGLISASRGLLEPDAPARGREAIGTADVVVVPGLAATRRGMRLGRGGGCYDRALGRVPVGTPVIVVLHPEEVLDQLPVAAHDRRVSHIVTCDGVIACRA